jgi:hypothetical protein
LGTEERMTELVVTSAILQALPAMAKMAKEMVERLQAEAPLLTREKGESTLQPPDKRIAWGIARQGDKRVIALLIEDQDSWALRKAQELIKDNADSVIVRVTGRAQVSNPETARRVPADAPCEIGSSVSHFRGFAGSIGCFVEAKVKRNKPSVPAFLGAAHVLNVNNGAERGEPVISPGFPDGPRSLANRVGKLRNTIFLVHHQDADTPRNTVDAAVVEIDEDAEIEPKNLVPDPERPDRRAKLNGLVGAEELSSLIGSPVYKCGRTTGFTSGSLEIVGVNRYAVRLTNGRVYQYDDLLCIKRDGKKPFSDGGDSGALVYTQDRRGLGLIVGGSSEYSFVSPLEPCLEAMACKLI